MTTIYDVARLAGVSPATVSRVFNGAKVSDDKVTAVRQAAVSLGFVPNANARRLRMGSSHLVAILVPDIENPFFTALTRGVADVVRSAGYAVLLANTDDDPETEAEVIANAVADRLAGLIVVPSRRTTDVGAAAHVGVPVVCVDRETDETQIDTVILDNLGAAREAVGGLFAAGYRRPACITGPAEIMTAELRRQGWAAAWSDQGLEAPETLVRREPFTVEGGVAGLRSLLAEPDPPDAVFAANNRLALGALQVLFDLGRDPSTFGVVSLGSLPYTLYTPAGVSVLSLPARSLGERAARLLLDRIQGYDGPPRHEVISEG